MISRRRAARVLVLALLVVLAGPLIHGVMQLPVPGQADAPAHASVSANYVAHGADLAGAENLVTGILLNFRALDTFGEVIVIFTAWLAVVAVSGPSMRTGRGSIPVSPVVDYIIRVLGPFIAVFALFVIVNGHVLPGGGFQGGVVLGAMLILLSLVSGAESVAGSLSARNWAWLRAAGVLVFASVAVIGLLATGHLFGLSADPVLRQSLMIVLELGIGVGGGTVLAGLYFAISGTDQA